MTAVTVEKLSDPARLLADWRALYERAGNASIFLSPAWMEAWLGGAPPQAVLYAVRGESALLGVVGLSPRRRPWLIGSHTAHLHEYGDDVRDSVYIEYNDFLLARGAPSECRQKALLAVIDAVGPVDELILRNARADLADAARAAAAMKGYRIRVLTRQPTFAIDLAALREAGGAYLETRSPSLRAQVRRAERLYEQRGTVALRRAETPQERARAWETLIALHEESWRRRGLKGVFDNEAFKAFHERLARAAPERIDILQLFSGEEVVACLYNLVDGDHVHNYQSGFKFEDNNQLKPGMAAHAQAAQYYCDNGYSVYDLLAGEAPYKRRLADEGEVLTSLAIDLAAGPRAQILAGLRRLRGTLTPRRETRRT